MIVILGVLAGIAVPMFLSQRDKAYRTAMVSDLRGVTLAQALRSVDGTPIYTTSLQELRERGYQNSEGVPPATVFLFDNGTPQFIACVKHEAVDEWLVYSSVDAVQTYSPTQCVQPPG